MYNPIKCHTLTEVIGSESHGLHRFQPSAAFADATAKQSVNGLPSVAGHRAVKHSYVDKLELLDALCQDPSPSLGKDAGEQDGPHRLASPPLNLSQNPRAAVFWRCISSRRLCCEDYPRKLSCVAKELGRCCLLCTTVRRTMLDTLPFVSVQSPGIRDG